MNVEPFIFHLYMCFRNDSIEYLHQKKNNLSALKNTKFNANSLLNKFVHVKNRRRCNVSRIVKCSYRGEFRGTDLYSAELTRVHCKHWSRTLPFRIQIWISFKCTKNLYWLYSRFKSTKKIAFPWIFFVSKVSETIYFCIKNNFIINLFSFRIESLMAG